MEYTRHISLFEIDGQSVVTVEDLELFDLLDDFFVEHDVIPAFISKGFGQDGKESQSLHFKPPQSIQSLLQLLNQIPTSEIERVHAINQFKK